MASAASPSPLARWAEDPTTARAVGQALDRLWTEAAAGRPRDDGRGPAAGIVRTGVINFLAYATSTGHRERALNAMGQFTDVHPGRSILLHAEPHARAAGLGAQLTACRGDRGVCFDEVRLETRNMEAADVASLTSWLCLREIPVLLWWLPEPAEDDPRFSALAPLADLVVVDSASFTAPARLRRLARVAAGFHGRPCVVDLNWDRLVGWRELAAQLFDAPAARECLDQVDAIEITYENDSHQPHASAQALLLAGWLAASLGLTPDAAERSAVGIAVRLISNGHDISLTLRGATGGGRPGSVSRLEFACGSASRFAIEVDPRRSRGTTTSIIDGGSPVSRSFPFAQPSDALLLAEEIEALGVDCALVGALDQAAKIADLIDAAD